MLDNLNKYRILLASKSPRRRELLSMLDIPFEIPADIEVEERYPDDLDIFKVPLYLSRLKAEGYKDILMPQDLMITADTVVIHQGKIIGKPANEDEAASTLRALSGDAHTVVTGVSITTLDRQVSFDTHTQVRFAELSDSEIAYYVEKYKPLDKAGAYGIQEWIGAVAVEGIEGSFYNVMGLPIHQLYLQLRDF